MASTHHFATGITLSLHIHPAVLGRKLNSFIRSLMVGIGANRLEMVLKGVEGSAGNNVS